MTRILILDDEPAILDALKIVLEAKGYEVATVNEPRLLQEELNRKLPSLMLVDLSMPGMDGTQVTQRLKAEPATAHIPVVVVSAHTDVEEKAQLAGADDYLEKPFRMNELLTKIERFIS